MPIMKKMFTALFMISALTGCKDKISDTYLKEHPAFLIQEVDRCQAMQSKTEAQSAQCDIIMNAAVSLKPIVDEQQSEPEKFGQRVLDAEMAYAKMKVDLNAASQAVQSLRAKNASSVEIQTAQAKLDEMKKQTADKRQELRVLLAVVGLSSPE